MDAGYERKSAEDTHQLNRTAGSWTIQALADGRTVRTSGSADVTAPTLRGSHIRRLVSGERFDFIGSLPIYATTDEVD